MPTDKETLKELIEQERNRMEHTDRTYCKVCGIAIAPFDPTRIQRGLEVYHQSCWDKKRKEAENEAAVLNSRARDIRSYWGFRALPRVH
jgi:tRNA A37 N6-isopentenylltransferase MiaA